MIQGGIIQAEQAVIGALLIDSDVHEFVFGELRVDDFELGIDRDLFSASLRLWANGDAVDPVTVLNAVGGGGNERQYLADVLALTVTTANVKSHVAIVKEQSRMRMLGRLADDVANGVFGGGESSEIIAALETRIEELSRERQSQIISSNAASDLWGRWVSEQMSNPDHAIVRTGYAKLDKQLGGGFFKTGFYVVGGRPGMGKTTMALNIANRIAINGKRVLFLSLEMSLEQIVSKVLAIESGLPYSMIYKGEFAEQYSERVSYAVKEFREKQFDIVADGVSTAQALAALLRSQKDIDVVFVDYMGILEPAEDDRQKPKYEQMTNISKALKAIAKRSGIPVVALSQLNRNSLTGATKRPNLADLRDTGAIEQDADGVILVHRPGYFDENENPNDIELIVAKNRHDSTGTVLLTWNAESGRVTETDREF